MSNTYGALVKRTKHMMLIFAAFINGCLVFRVTWKYRMRYFNLSVPTMFEYDLLEISLDITKYIKMRFYFDQD